MLTNYLMKAKGIAKKIVRDETGANTEDVAAEVTALVERFPAYPH